MDYPEIGKIYKHYKGGDYKVLTLAKHTETDEILVIYKSIQFGSIYARPLHVKIMMKLIKMIKMIKMISLMLIMIV